jgi:sugar transferase (PEP-CTERM/EpsH1 system associated)
MDKLVVITSRFPYPLDKGDKLRAYNQIKFLSKHKEIYLFCLTDEKINDENIKHLEVYCKEIEIFTLTRLQTTLNLIRTIFTRKPFQVGYFYNKTIHKIIHNKINKINPSFIYCQLVRCAEYVKNEYHIPKLIDYMDTLSKGMERRIPSSPFYMRKILRIETNRLKKYESVLYVYFDKHTIISHQDQELIFLEEREKIKVIPNGIDIDFFKPKEAEKKYDLLFNGNMQYEPNVVGALYIANEILPLIHKVNPNVSLLISGTSPTKEIIALKSDKIYVSGWINDIRDAYNSAKVFIAPMQIGTGLQNKLLEAMAMKLPSVTSKLANNALNAKAGEEILIGNSAQDYANIVIDLLENEELRNNIAENGFKYVTSTFNWEKSTEMLNDFLDN